MEVKKETPSFHWSAYFAEMAGTALLFIVGLSIVIFLFGFGSPME